MNEIPLQRQIKMREWGYSWAFLSRVAKTDYLLDSSACKLSLATSSFTLTSVMALWKAVCLRGAGGTRRHLLMGCPTFSLSLFSPVFPFTIPSVACIYAWFSSLPASFLSIAGGSPQGYRNFWSLVQDLHHHPHPYSFVPYPCSGAKLGLLCLF